MQIQATHFQSIMLSQTSLTIPSLPMKNVTRPYEDGSILVVRSLEKGPTIDQSQGRLADLISFPRCAVCVAQNLVVELVLIYESRLLLRSVCNEERMSKAENKEQKGDVPRETPTTSSSSPPLPWNTILSFLASLNAHASFVHPVVNALGKKKMAMG
jgi:hypothetical protein